MSQGTKINTRKEHDPNHTYLGIKVYRFYFKCSNCKSTIIIRTDPKNSDYIVETGATRNREAAWCDESKRKRDDDDELMMGSMECIEMRRMKAVREIGLIDNLEELKSIKSLQAGISSDYLLMRCTKGKDKDVEEEPKPIFRRPSSFIKRIDDEDEHESIANYNNSVRIKHGSKDLSKFHSSPSPIMARVSIVKKHCPTRTQQLSDSNSAAALQALGHEYDSDGD
ncbi:Yju2 splicing factor-like protein [Thalictrum thalictroides]|uniref:Yju2 splicing factor-like protein n=1 Tax=Thalictrum thalictroides TaxID=46969 RepID=A0A7J6W736_THATH|nr:Yju2 splicing factor-like protein [Thalictrum thalictroides]